MRSADSEPVENGAGSETPRRHFVRDPIWCASFAVLFALTASRTFASPLLSVNDEPANVVDTRASADCAPAFEDNPKPATSLPRSFSSRRWPAQSASRC